MTKIYDCAIIGAGPVGMFASYYANMRELDVCLIDSNEQLGGQLSSLYPEKYIYDVAGFDKILAKDLVANLEKQMSKYDFDVKLNTNLKEIKDGEIKTLITDKGEIKAKAIILCAGNGAFEPRKIGKANEAEFSNIKYNVGNLSDYTNKVVSILGGGDSALDWACEISNVAKEVNIIHRREDFRAAEHSATLASNIENINFIKPVIVKELIGSNDQCSEILVKDKNTKEDLSIKNDIVLVQYGYITNLKALENLDIEFGDKNKIIVNRDMSTNMDGVYAIGDCITYPSRQDLIITGMGEAPIAVVSVAKYLNPEKIIGTMHSSSLVKEK